MDDVVSLINHLLQTKHSIDTVDSILEQLKFSNDHLLQILNNPSSSDYFQLLRSSNNRNKRAEKIALTLDLFCCTHYGTQCKNESCPFLHLCPYNVRHMHSKCTNRTCPYDHDVLKSIHNRRILDARHLSSIPTQTLHALTRASADPNRSFWVCTDFGKKDGCKNKNQCDKLHYCYYYLTDACTKPYCQHEINDSCLAYFRRKELIELEHRDILDAVRKVLRQRKVEFISKAIAYNQSSSASTSSNLSASHDPGKRTSNQPRRTSSNSEGTKSEASRIESPAYKDKLSSNTGCVPSAPEHEKDICLLDHYDKDGYATFERFLSDELGFPIQLLVSKNIYSESKEKTSANICSKPIYYYCPSKAQTDVFDLLRWQNEEKQRIKPLTVYSSVRDAHDEAEQNENNQFCIFRVHLFPSDVTTKGKSKLEDCLRLNNPSTMCFDRMWVYIYNLR